MGAPLFRSLIAKEWGIERRDHPHWALTCMPLAPVLATLLGPFAYRSAHTFRGSLPQRFPWVTPEEFSGLPTS